MDGQQPADIPPELQQLIHLNRTYHVLICQECHKVVEPGAFVEHLRVQHQTSLRDRERVQQFISTFSWNYTFQTVQLPPDGSRPQSVIPVVDGLQCRTFPFKTSNRKGIKVHRNKEHGQQRVGNDKLFRKVRLQS